MFNYASDKRLYVNNVKVAYLAHGPCLTHVRFHGYYGDRAIEFQVGIRMLRTDDYCHTYILSVRLSRSPEGRFAQEGISAQLAPTVL